MVFIPYGIIHNTIFYVLLWSTFARKCRWCTRTSPTENPTDNFSLLGLDAKINVLCWNYWHWEGSSNLIIRVWWSLKIEEERSSETSVSLPVYMTSHLERQYFLKKISVLYFLGFFFIHCWSLASIRNAIAGREVSGHDAGVRNRTRLTVDSLDQI